MSFPFYFAKDDRPDRSNFVINYVNAEKKEDYPKTPVVLVDIPLWTPEERKKYINERISLHQNAQINYDLHNKLPLCSDDERWKKKDSWAVRKKAQKRALRVLDTKLEAIEYVEWHEKTNTAYMPKYTGGYEIDFRQGEYNRCKGNYCSVADFCQQYNKGVKNGKEEN